MDKEKLTRDKFLIDFAKPRAIHILFTNLFVFGLFFLCAYLMSVALKYPWICKVGGIVLALIYLYKLIDFTYKCIRLRTGKYFILKDSVIGSSEGSSYTKAVLVRYSRYVPPSLIFKCYDTYYIPRGEHYTWSQKNRMFENSVYNSSNIDDEFYILSFDKKRVALVYNTKLFDLVS